jgi:hypothetical protein
MLWIAETDVVPNVECFGAQLHVDFLSCLDVLEESADFYIAILATQRRAAKYDRSA